MYTLTANELKRQPQQFSDDRGVASLPSPLSRASR